MSQLEKVLHNYFGHHYFREGQKEIIDDLINGESVLGVLPTGSGKSICYQLPSLLLKGSVIVISPLLSLMEDQVKQLKAKGMKDIVAINSFVNRAEKQQVLQQLSRYKLIYVSPEMIQNKQLLERLSHMNISLFVVDEAHCISQWGHEFRPDYLKLVDVIAQLNDPSVLALSATATPDVQKDIIKYLNKPSMIKHIYPMDRKNIAFTMQQCENKQEKVSYMIDLLQKFRVPTMIYFSSKKEAEDVASQLSYHLPELRVAFYHGGMDGIDRTLIQQQFMENQLDIICCTSAFGMGIDKQNVRLIIHYHFPTQIESFIQEVGRAGRDGLSSVSVVLHAPFDTLLPKRLIESELPTMEQVRSFVSFLEKKYETNSVTINKHEMMMYLSLNEVQYRFIIYHLENHAILKENQILPIYDRRGVFLKEIEKVISNRSQYKLRKLREMVTWINTTNCRRKALFRSFQTTLKEPTYACCDYCDFRFDDWAPIQEKTKTATIKGWKSELAMLFLQSSND
ncbi:ATP-dependent DNA helicase RecQ [Paraliobacillus sp. PM-2]|uniref:RecQ family ATP-dependent DNA helicase n=1 Tax=Paraliobacillus sp. PM-2 TaxID=1462524 RepID=UPI00061B911F|nr:RecQ family ATP-dependent DNA helicase [Paraliobacillus sp. PM-2]CQR46720.1 ATP-dependent DNA helicase RecQ [Paraliobacillus sp. PM-2]